MAEAPKRIARQRFRVRIAPEMLESMTLAAVEAYCFSRKGRRTALGGNTKRYTHEETLGYMWGVKRKTENTTIISVERMSISVTAKRMPNSVIPNEDAGRLMNEIVKSSSPHLTFLGDFHSHPYVTYEDVRINKGYEFSKYDYEYLLADDFAWRETDNQPLMIGIAVCRTERVRTSVLEYMRPNIASYAIGEFKFWINASVGYKEEYSGKRRHTTDARSRVDLDVDNYLFNHAGNRVSE